MGDEAIERRALRDLGSVAEPVTDDDLGNWFSPFGRRHVHATRRTRRGMPRAAGALRARSTAVSGSSIVSGRGKRTTVLSSFTAYRSPREVVAGSSPRVDTPPFNPPPSPISFRKALRRPGRGAQQGLHVDVHRHAGDVYFYEPLDEDRDRLWRSGADDEPETEAPAACTVIVIDLQAVAG
jgi:hypothetical protein